MTMSIPLIPVYHSVPYSSPSLACSAVSWLTSCLCNAPAPVMQVPPCVPLRRDGLLLGPCPDRFFIAFWHAYGLDFLGGEQSNGFVLWAMGHAGKGPRITPIRDNE